MWDEIFAEVAGDVTGSIGKKCDDGVKRSVTPNGPAPVDLTDTDKWIKSVEKVGAKVDQKAKTDDGSNAANGVKELDGKRSVRCLKTMFGNVKSKKPKDKDAEKGDADDTKLETAK